MHFSVLTHLQTLQKSDMKTSPADQHDFAEVHDWFETAMMQQIEDMMKPYDENTSNPTHLEFVDMSESVLKDYHEKGQDVVRLPNGSIHLIFERWFHDNYIVENGLVLQRKWGQLHHPKRTKKAKQMQVIENYPFDRLYPSLDRFAEDWYGYHYHEAAQAYGYYSNPNGHYDWYQVGGRWPDRLLIAADDPFYVPGEKTWAATDEEKKAPDGYRWVTGARKSAIQWELMKSLAADKATKLFHQLEQWFTTGTKPTELDDGFRLMENNIAYWGDLVRRKDTTLEQFLLERGLAPEQRFLLGAFYIINDGIWACQDDYSDESNRGSDILPWSQYMEQYLDGLSDDAFIVTLDIHD